VRFRMWPKWSTLALLPAIPLILISLGAGEDGAYLVSALSAASAIVVIARALIDAGFAVGTLSRALGQLNES